MKIPPGHAFPTSSMHVMGKEHKGLGFKKKNSPSSCPCSSWKYFCGHSAKGGIFWQGRKDINCSYVEFHPVLEICDKWKKMTVGRPCEHQPYLCWSAGVLHKLDNKTRIAVLLIQAGPLPDLRLLFLQTQTSEHLGKLCFPSQHPRWDFQHVLKAQSNFALLLNWSWGVQCPSPPSTPGKKNIFKHCLVQSLCRTRGLSSEAGNT